MSKPETMRAYRRPTGSAEISGLELMEVPIPRPEAGEVLVQLKAIGLNPVDGKSTSTGVDGAGVVVECGAGVESDVIGRRVFFHVTRLKPGSFAEFVTLRAAVIAEIPESMSFETAAMLPCPGGTALDIISRLTPLDLRVERPAVLVRAAAGAVGSLVVQLAAARGWRVIGSCSPHSFETVLAYGADCVVDRRQPRADEKLELAKFVHSGHVDAVVNLVDAASAVADMQLLRHRGVLVAVVGRPNIASEPNPDPLTAVVPRFALAPTVAEVALGAAYASGDDRDLRELAFLYSVIADQVVQGALKLPEIEYVPFEELKSGLQMLMTGKANIKYIIKMA
jgi:NADPH:quinone reductase-like Zn-dependent oxidoreductase